MSHFTVAVIADEVDKLEELLAPYQENNMGDCPKQYLEFINIEDEYRNQYENDTSQRIEQDGKMVYVWDYKGEVDKSKIVHVPFKETYPTFEEFMEDYCGYDKKDPDHNAYGYYENPNAKWDYWTLGGRWQGLLKPKFPNKTNIGYQGRKSLLADDQSLENYDIMQVGDIDFSLDIAEYNDALARWEIVVENREPRNDHEKEMRDSEYRSAKYFKSKWDTKEDYAKDMSKLKTFALITPDGAWHAEGEMLMFGIDTGEKDDLYEYNKFFDQTIEIFTKHHPEYWMMIVDCHI